MPQRLDAVPLASPEDTTVEELVGRVSTAHNNYSVARLHGDGGWRGPAQLAEFEEVCVVIAGELLVEHDDGTEAVPAGEQVIVRPGERVRYAAGEDGVDYLSVCVPAFSERDAHRE
ncbi:cupin domain-containing protein [Ornithinicoccus halotolerans]|uniref:cupin domain-containing protein n=1 Tax=Ornithinicoccus halotolerans TaxID=1748220 RepID=UPI0012979ECE|nr:AraC family ligand binding domain-containing protein [Ornithinicoccus halotolerans]